MNRQIGISSIGAALLAAVVAGGGAGAYAWHQHQGLVQARGELTRARADLQTATASLGAARTQLETVRKELDDQKSALDQARAERDSAKVLFEAEKQRGERLQADLTLAREQLAYMRTRQAPAFAAPQLVQPQILRVMPAQGGRAIGRASPAPAPLQGAPAAR